MSKKNKKKEFGEEVTPDEFEMESEERESEQVTQSSGEADEAWAAADDYKRKWYAVTAEYENFRKRNAAAVSNAYRDGAFETVLKLLPVADNFGYALDSAKDEKTREGIDKIIKSFNTILSSMGIEEVVILPGDPFDETIAEAIVNYPCEDGENPNTIKFVMKKGYKSGDKMVRYAQVAVTV